MGSIDKSVPRGKQLEMPIWHIKLLEGEIMDKTNIEPTSLVSTYDVRDLIYHIRNQQVMIDSDLAYLYQVETGALNRAVKRNIARFPEDFCFQITFEEYENLKCQSGISSLGKSGYGGRRTLPYAFTEQGISMLSGVLHTNVAVNVSVGIMRAFVEMRNFITNNSLLFERISKTELKQLEYEKKTDAKLDEIFKYIKDNEESSQKIFFDGQIYDAFSLIADIIKKADSEIILIDNYVDLDTLNLLAKKKNDIKVTIYTLKQTNLSKTDVANFNKQYPKLILHYTRTFHDRFLIIDNRYAYHIGASVKDAGKKCFAINLIQDVEIVHNILKKLNNKTLSHSPTSS